MSVSEVVVSHDPSKVVTWVQFPSRAFMSKFPDEMKVTLIDDLYINYELAFEDAKKTVYIFCNTCNDVVGTLDYDTIKDNEEMDLYELIIATHRKI